VVPRCDKELDVVVAVFSVVDSADTGIEIVIPLIEGVAHAGSGGRLCISGPRRNVVSGRKARLNQPAVIEFHGGKNSRLGDWLVRDAQGNLVRCDDINFKCTYESVASAIRIEDLNESKPCGC